MTAEDRLSIACSNYMKAKYPNVIAFHVANERKTKTKQNSRGGYYNPEGGKLKMMGVLSGVSDWLIDQPIAPYGGLRIELKVEKVIGAKNGKPVYSRKYPKPEQKKFLRKAHLAGYAIAVCWNIDQFMKTVDSYLSGQFELSDYVINNIVKERE